MMEDVIDLIVGNLGVSLEYLILLMTVLGCIIFMTKDFRLGLIIMFVMFMAEYMMFYLLGLNTFAALIAIFVNIVVLALSIYVTHSKSTVGVI